MRRPFRLGRVEHDLDEELEFHLAARERALIAAGVAPEDARARALARFGDRTAVRAECLAIDQQKDRAMRQADFVSNLRQDAAYAVRTLMHNTAFAVVMLLILALGIGANTAIFTLIDALMLRPLPVPHAEELVTIGDPHRTGSLSDGTPRSDLASYPLYADVRDQTHSVTGVYAQGRVDQLDVRIERGGDAEHPHGRFVSGNFFSVLQVNAIAGRTFTADEDRVPGGDPVVVISHNYWQQRFAGAASVVGRVMSVNGVSLTIVGVTPSQFTGDIVGQSADLWIPLMMQPTLMPHSPRLTDRTVSWLLLMGRRAPGVTLDQARVEIAALATRSLVDHASVTDLGGIRRQLRQTGVPVADGARGFSYYRHAYETALITLMAAVSLVLLVVCANVANLMLARAASRGREMSVRIALGAGRLRLIQQLLTESAVLAIAGSACGLLIALVGSKALLYLASGGPTPIPLTLRLDARVLGFTAALAVVTAVLFGLVPALRATQLDVASALRMQGRGAGTRSGGGSLPFGKVLVVAQVALSMLLLVGAGMLVRSTQRLQHADIGVARDKLVVANVDAARSGYTGPRLLALMRTLPERVAELPGVAGATISENGIFSGTESGLAAQVEGFTARADSDTLVAYDDVGPRYFHVTGAHILQGRDFEASDNETSSRVAVLNATAAKFFFPRGDAVGHHFLSDSATREIVGVVADVEEQGVREAPVRRFYVPTAQMKPPPGAFYLEIRAVGDPTRLVVPLRQLLRTVDASLVVRSIDPVDDNIRDSISQDRLVATVVTFFGALALVLAALGLYGVMAYATVRRTSEFGLRMALGAAPGDVTRLILREATTLTVGGMLVGLPIALVATQLVRKQLYGIGLFDPPSIGLAILVLAVSGIVAGYLPALRASRVAPLEAIRAE